MSTRKRKIVSYREPLTDPSESDVDVEDFHPSTSTFNYIEEEALKIRLQPQDEFRAILGEDFVEQSGMNMSMPTSLTDLYLPGYDKDEILTFSAKGHPELSEDVVSFLLKLKLVVLNNQKKCRCCK